MKTVYTIDYCVLALLCSKLRFRNKTTAK